MDAIRIERALDQGLSGGRMSHGTWERLRGSLSSDYPSRRNTLNWNICWEPHGVACWCRWLWTSRNPGPSVCARLALS